MKDIIASLVFDSWTEPTPELRAPTVNNRHLIFEGDGVVLDLLLKRQGNGTCIHVGGQVFPADDSLDTVSDVQVLVEQGHHRTCTHTNALGEFAFDTVPDGVFDLAITLNNRRFLVRGLSNKEPRRWRVVQTAARG